MTKKKQVDISEHFDRCGTLQSIGDVPILSKKEQNVLLINSLKGDEKSKHELALSNMRLVCSIANKYTGLAKSRTYLDFDDLVILGYEGLVAACEKFGPDKIGKIAFSTYATFWIKQAITREISNSTIAARIPVHTVDDVFAVMRAASKFEQETGIQISNEEMLRIIRHNPKWKKSEESILRAINIMSSVSIYTPVGEDSDSTLGDFISLSAQTPEDEALLSHTAEIIKEAMESLSDMEQLVLKERFGLTDGRNRTLEEIGNSLNLSRERIRQIEAKALKKLRMKRPVLDLLR